MKWTKGTLKAFEKWCEMSQDNQMIKSPIHLSGGNEDQLIKIFKDIKKKDWVFTTYRSHYHALLKGVDIHWLKKWILNNKSIHVMNKKNRIVTSAIVGGTLPQAVGMAMSIKRRNGKEKVWCFIGDMTASLGIFMDCYRYSLFNDLPITFVIENNDMSTDTPTREAWGCKEGHYCHIVPRKKAIAYNYVRIYPHYGTKNRVPIT